MLLMPAAVRFEEQIAAVEKILEELEINDKPTIRVLNKSDCVADKDLLQTSLPAVGRRCCFGAG